MCVCVCVCVSHISLIQLFINRNSAAMKIGVHISFKISVFIFSGFFFSLEVKLLVDRFWDHLPVKDLGSELLA